MKKYFWESWKRKTKIETKAIETVQIALRFLLKNLDKKEIISVYIKGSMAKREMNPRSDVDFFIVTKYGKIIPKKLSSIGTRDKKFGRPNPKRITSHLPFYKRIYGKELDYDSFAKKNPKSAARGMAKVFIESFIPMYEKKKMDFQNLIKQVFWLTYEEQEAKGNNAQYHWGKLASHVKDKNHIIHDAIKFRKNPTKDKEIRKKFITKLKKHVKKLKKEFAK
jgi:predicted nucleotidyltransferase